MENINHVEQSELLELKAKIMKAIGEAHREIANQIGKVDDSYIQGEESMLEFFKHQLLD